VISACAAGGRWQRAVSLFDEMLSWGIKPDVVSCTALITALGTDGQWERAEKVGAAFLSWACWSGLRLAPTSAVPVVVSCTEMAAQQGPCTGYAVKCPGPTRTPASSSQLAAC
jgi:pentatricopeptide repeat protein